MKKHIFLILILTSCNPKPDGTATACEEPTTTMLPTTTSPEQCIQCDVENCNIDEFCDFRGIFTNPHGCLVECKVDDPLACKGKPEDCTHYKDDIFACAPECFKIAAWPPH